LLPLHFLPVPASRQRIICPWKVHNLDRIGRQYVVDVHGGPAEGAPIPSAFESGSFIAYHHQEKSLNAGGFWDQDD
jgi:hypothetical protein